MLQKDSELNIKRSFYKFLRERLGANYYINYSMQKDEKLAKRIVERAPADYWRWIEINWLRVGDSIFSTSVLQINCNTIVANDPFGVALAEMVDEVQEELNVDTIGVFDFSDDPYHPVPIDNVLVPRFRGSRALPNAAGDTVNVEAIDYNVYVWRESVLP